MPHEVLELRRVHISTVVKPLYEVFDALGSSQNVSSASWILIQKSDGSLLTSGSCVVNNADQDQAGNTIRTIQPTIDLSQPGISVGYHSLVFYVLFTNGESDEFEVPLEVINYV